MSLRGFHIVFIFCSIILAGWFAHWQYEHFQETQVPSDLWIAGASAAACLGLVAYLFWFLKKVQKAGK